MGFASLLRLPGFSSAFAIRSPLGIWHVNDAKSVNFTFKLLIDTPEKVLSLSLQNSVFDKLSMAQNGPFFFLPK
jgi:hypothetical protein